MDFPEPLPLVYGGSFVAGAVAFGDGYVAVGSVNGGCCTGAFTTDSHGVIWRSRNGLTWTMDPRSAVFDLARLRGLATDRHRLVAIGATLTDDAGDAGEHPAVWVSTDGRTWQRVDGVPSFAAVVATTSAFVAAADGTAGPEVWTSSDGLHWSIVATSSILGPGEVRAMAVTPAGIVAVGSGSARDATTQVAAAWRSPDGVRWTRATSQPWFSNASMNGLAVSGSSIVAVGNDLATGSAVWRSDDGLSWTRAAGMPIAAGAASVFGVVAASRGFLVVGAIEGNLPRRLVWESVDGTAWTSLDPPAGLGADSLFGLQAGDDLILFTMAFDGSLGRAVPQAWSVRSR